MFFTSQATNISTQHYSVPDFDRSHQSPQLSTYLEVPPIRTMAQPKIINTASEFEALLKTTTFVAVDFHATWCGPCHAIAPTYAKLASSLTIPGIFEFAKVDVDAVPDVTEQYGVTAMPTFLFFHNGKPYAGRAMLRGADPRTLVATAQELGKLAKQEEAMKAAKEGEETQQATEAAATVSGGYTIGSQAGSRAGWKTSLRG
jgi:thioredoxin 1